MVPSRFVFPRIIATILTECAQILLKNIADESGLSPSSDGGLMDRRFVYL